MSDKPEVCAQLVALVKARGAEIQGLLGLHIEGPFFAQRRNGAHAISMIRSPQQDLDSAWLEMLAQLNKNGLAAMLTCAPEVFPLDWIANLSKTGLKIALGHSDASYNQAMQAFRAGASGVTHLYNAMPALINRQPSLLTASLNHDESWASIICDGYHVDPANIALAAKIKKDAQLFLVSDAMATVGATVGLDGAHKTFQLYGETLTEKEGQLINAQGRLAGAAIGMIDAVKYAIEQVGLPVERVLRMASLYPACAMNHAGSPQRGLLEIGYRADFAQVTTDWQVISTWVAGTCCFKKQTQALTQTSS